MSEYPEAIYALLGLAPPGTPATSREFRYTVLRGAERDRCLLEVVRALGKGRLEEWQLDPSGPERLARWETGWQENLDGFRETGSLESLVPRYYGKHPVMRLHGQYVRPRSPKFELDFFHVAREAIHDRYLREFETIYEFGCGTGLNLANIALRYPEKRLVGLDWAQPSQELIRIVGTRLGLNLEAKRFDMFAPGDLRLRPGSAALTFASMEQLGSNFQGFVDLLRAEAALCIHIEPIVELYDDDLLMDHLAARYHRQRGYLEGFLPYLRSLEAAGQVELLDVRRLHCGNLFHEGSLVVWRPVVTA